MPREQNEDSISADDLHKSKNRFLVFEKKTKSSTNSSLEKAFQKYLSLEKSLAQNNSMSWAGVKRSCEIAFEFVMNSGLESTDLESPEFVKKAELWWLAHTKRSAKQRMGDDSFIDSDRQLSNASLQKILTQIKKFFKFLKHMNKGREPELFNQKLIILPEELNERLSFNPRGVLKKKMSEPNVHQIKAFCDYLQSKPSFTKTQLSALIALLYDSGLRFSECMTLKITSIEPKEDFYLASLESSKTAQRTIILYASKSYLKSWLAIHPQKNNSNALLFCDKNGNMLDYQNASHLFKSELKKYNLKQKDALMQITWPEGKSFHYLRHLFVSRTDNWSDVHRNYWLGWSQKGMMNVYGKITWEKCKSNYFEMLEKEHNPFATTKTHALEEKEEIQRKTLTDLELTQRVKEIMAKELKQIRN
ncbi:MAG: tyrosine-type recombinase/integrase [archaeon]